MYDGGRYGNNATIGVGILFKESNRRCHVGLRNDVVIHPATLEVEGRNKLDCAR